MYKTTVQATILMLAAVLSSTGAKMNVLFIISDDMRPQLGSYHGPDSPTLVHPKMHTPNLDALASKSLLLKRAYVQQALCSPSRSSFLTGRRPDTTHVHDLLKYFRKVGGNFTTLPQYFKQNGYRSFGIGKIFHPGSASGHDDPDSWTEPYYLGDYNEMYESKNYSWAAVPDDDLIGSPLRDRLITDKAKETLRLVAPKAKSGEENFFVAVGFRSPHLPFVFPASILRYYNQSDIRQPSNPYAPVHLPDVAWYDYAELRNQYSDIGRLNASGTINTTFPDSLVLSLRRGYYCAVTFVDQLMGEIMNELETQGLSNNTIVSFIGDHGWQLGEHGEWGKMTNFELATRAPMMVHIPGRTDHGVESSMLAEFVDLYPTLVEASGLDHVPLCPEDSSTTAVCHEGTSLLPLISQPNTAVKHAAFSQMTRDLNIMGYSVRTDRFRYTEWVDFTYSPTYSPNWDILHGVELYDHVNDPDENYNGAADPEYRKARADLRNLLHRGWRHTTNDHGEIVG